MQPFEFGLVLAGAVSAGSYSAGVLDFLVEAVDDYYREQERTDWRGPRHEVKLRVISGTSAGGITAALGAGALFRDILHVDAERQPERGRNPLYDAWVRDIDISGLLATRDLGPDKSLISLLDSTILEEVADRAVQSLGKLAFRTRPWVEDPLPVYITATNLRGLPYGFDIFASGQTATYGMTSHADEVAFAVGSIPPTDAHMIAVNASEPDPTTEGWDHLVEAGLATGAFPIGLAARRVRPPMAKYKKRPLLPPPVFGDDTWSQQAFHYVAVDGGVIDNEPLEITRRHLSGSPDEHNPQEGDKACRAVLLVDPFPNEIESDPPPLDDPALAKIAFRLVAALKNQARFKPEELRIVLDPEVYSRFMIAPSRRIGDSDERLEPALATGQLGGFSGFFAEAYRRHDYLLGRRNCQSFLKRYFVLPERNRLFDDLGAEEREPWYARERDGTLREVRISNRNAETSRALPIIPVTPRLQTDIAIHQRDVPPAGTAAVNLYAIRRQIERRAEMVIDCALAEWLPKRWYRPDQIVIRRVVRNKLLSGVTDFAMREIQSGLREWQ